MKANPDLEETQVPADRGGGVVVKCKLCLRTWWLDEGSAHETYCKHYEPPSWLRAARPARNRRKAGGGGR